MPGKFYEGEVAYVNSQYIAVIPTGNDPHVAQQLYNYCYADHECHTPGFSPRNKVWFSLLTGRDNRIEHLAPRELKLGQDITWITDDIPTLGPKQKIKLLDSLLEQARNENATEDEIKMLEARLELFFKNPDRYQRLLDLNDCRGFMAAKPLPYEGR